MVNYIFASYIFPYTFIDNNDGNFEGMRLLNDALFLHSTYITALWEKILRRQDDKEF